MDILLIVATLAVAAAGLYVAATFNRRTRQQTAPLIDGAVKDISGHVDETAAELRRQLKAIGGELQRDRDQIRLDGRKIQGRLDHADSRMTSIANQLLAELEAVRRLGEQLGARQDQLGADLRQLDHTVTERSGSPVRPEATADRTVADDHADRTVADDHADRTVAADHADRTVADDHADRTVAADHADRTVAADHADPTTFGALPVRPEPATARTTVGGLLIPPQRATGPALVGAPPGPPAGPAVVPGRLYAERLRFALVRTQPDPGALVRILLQRCVAELPDPRLGDLGDATAIIGRAEHDEGFRARLGAAAAGYFAAEGLEPATPAATERWITPDAFPETAAAEVASRIGTALDAIAERPLAESGGLTWLQPAGAAGPSEQVTAFLEITGAMVGVLTGLRPLALGGATTLVHDRFLGSLGQGLVQAAGRVFGGPAPEIPQPPSSWWEP